MMDDPEPGRKKGKGKAPPKKQGEQENASTTSSSAATTSPDVVDDEASQHNPPVYPKDFKSLEGVTITSPSWSLIVNSLDHIKSAKLKRILIEWVIYEAEVEVEDMELTSM
jgi:hypothetical protein